MVSLRYPFLRGGVSQHKLGKLSKQTKAFLRKGGGCFRTQLSNVATPVNADLAQAIRGYQSFDRLMVSAQFAATKVAILVAIYRMGTGPTQESGKHVKENKGCLQGRNGVHKNGRPQSEKCPKIDDCGVDY